MYLNIYKGKQMTYCGKLYNKEMTISNGGIYYEGNRDKKYYTDGNIK